MSQNEPNSAPGPSANNTGPIVVIALAVVAAVVAGVLIFMAVQNRGQAQAATDAASTRVAEAEAAEAAALDRENISSTQIAQAEADNATAQALIEQAEADSATAQANVETAATAAAEAAADEADSIAAAEAAGTEAANAQATAESIPPTLTQVAMLGEAAAAEQEIAAALVAAAGLASTDPQAALAELTALNNQFPERPQVLVSRGQIYRQLGQSDNAIADFTDALAIDADLVAAYQGRGDIYLAQEQFADALADYNSAIDIAPNRATLYYNRGLVFQASNRFTLALDDFSQALLLDDSLAQAYIARGRLQRDLLLYDAAIADFTDALALNDQDPALFLERAALHTLQANTEAALADYNAAIDLDPTNADAFQQRGDLYYDLENFQAAAADYTAYADLTGALETYMADRLAAVSDVIPFALDEPEPANLAPRTDGAIPHDEDDNFIETFSPGNLLLQDFVVEATFSNPYDRERRNWDYGFFFRALDAGNYQLVVYSNAAWGLYYQGDEFELIQDGELANFDTSPTGSNTVRLEAQGDRGVLYVNGEFVANLDLSFYTGPGTLLLGTGFFTDSEINGAETAFSGLTIQVIGDLDDIAPPPTSDAPTRTPLPPTPTLALPTLTPFPTTAAATDMPPPPPPGAGGEAQIGVNNGAITSGGEQRWTYAGAEGETMTIRTEAEWDTVLALFLNGEEIAFNDDIEVFVQTNSEIVITLPATATYEIVVGGFDSNAFGPYQLVIESDSGLAKDPFTPTPGS